MSGHTFVAVDLGAESGRVVAGRFEDGAVGLEEVHRFSNRPLWLPDGLHWDVLGLFRECLDGIGRAGRRYRLSGVAVDSWGVDYGLLDERGRILGLPYHYRDPRTEQWVRRAGELISPADLYARTGIQTLRINTLYQLLAERDSAALREAARIAMIPDLAAFWLCGELANERTVASTTGLLDARTGNWARDVVTLLGLPKRPFAGTVEPGVVLAPLLARHREALGLRQPLPVIATAAHDTAAAFAAAPAAGADAAVLASGTWSLLGLVLDRPMLDQRARAANLANERGILGTIRLLRNVMGLWLLQECRRVWRAPSGEPPAYDELVREASAETDGAPALFDPDHPSLAGPCDMPGRIAELLVATGQQAPESRGQLVRAIVVSLACAYRRVLEQLESVSGRTITTVNIIGGGSRNALLCQLTADISRRHVLAGPSEASALGNVLVQALACELIGEDELATIARASAKVVTFSPGRDDQAPEETYGRFLALLRSSDAVHQQTGEGP